MLNADWVGNHFRVEKRKLGIPRFISFFNNLAYLTKIFSKSEKETTMSKQDWGCEKKSSLLQDAHPFKQNMKRTKY